MVSIRSTTALDAIDREVALAIADGLTYRDTAARVRDVIGLPHFTEDAVRDRLRQMRAPRDARNTVHLIAMLLRSGDLRRPPTRKIPTRKDQR